MNTRDLDNKVVVINGPTGIGKTCTSIALAEKLGTEIISFDSRQFYRELRIGTAAPDAEELSKVKHHFIGHLSIESNYSVYRFEKDALNLIDKLFSSHTHVIMTGGSGLYLDAVIQGMDDIPDPDPLIRAELQERYEKNGLAPLLQELQLCDPDYYRIVDHHNPKRVIRGLEVFLSAGTPFSSYRLRNTAARPFQVQHINLVCERSHLYQRIDQRVDQMISDGLLDEVKSLLPHRHRNGLKTVGYRELFSFLDGDCSWEETIRLIKRNTRHYARRQITWNRKYPFCLETAPEEVDQILAAVL